MDLATLINKIKVLVADVRNGDYLGAILIALEIIKALTVSIPPARLGVASMAPVDYGSSSVDDLCTELDGCCQVLDDMAAAPQGPLLDKLLPILLALLVKLIGV